MMLSKDSKKFNLEKEVGTKDPDLTFYYATFSPSRSVRGETNKPSAMRVRVEGYTKKTPNAIQ